MHNDKEFDKFPTCYNSKIILPVSQYKQLNNRAVMWWMTHDIYNMVPVPYIDIYVYI